MLHRLEVKAKYQRYYGNEQFEVKDDDTFNWLDKRIAKLWYEKHLKRPNVYSIKLYKLSWLGYKLIKEYDRGYDHKRDN